MPLGHPFRKWKKAKTSKSAKAPKRRRGFHLMRDIEPLEPRQLLTLLVGGDTLEFRHAGTDGQITQGIIERIKLFGNITVQAIGAFGSDIGFTDEDLPGTLTHANGITVTTGFSDPNIRGGTPIVGIQPQSGGVVGDLFALYVISSDSTGEIVVADVPELTVAQRPMLPFTSSIGVIKESNLRTTIAAPAGSGTALLGTRIPSGGNTPQNGPNPSSEPVTQLLLRHSYAGTPLVAGSSLTAGLIVAAGNTMGRFLFGGTVMGAIQVHGSIDTFYAGWLITGDATFASGYGIVSNPGNFNVDGDIRNLITKGSIGTDSNTRAQTTLGTGLYASGFDMHVGGSLGWLHTGGSLIGNVRVDHAPVPGTAMLGTTQWEVETRYDGIALDAPFLTNYPFAQGGTTLPGAPSGTATTTNFGTFDPFDVGLPGGDPIFTNDNYDTAQYLGSIPTTAGGPNSEVSVSGILEDVFSLNAANPNDFTDYYAVPLMAGQTITVQLTLPPAYLGPFLTAKVGATQRVTPLSVGVFDPDGRLIATDYSVVSPAATQGQPFRITTDRPGVYRFAVADFGNSEFETEPANAPGFVAPYTLTIQNVGDLAIGGILANQDILDDNITALAGGTGVLPSFYAGIGDFGALKAAGAIISENVGNSMFVANGNLRVLEGASIGTGPSTGSFDFETGIDARVPRGSVGLVNASGTPAGVPSPVGTLGGTVAGAAGSGSSEVAGIPFSPSQSVGGNERLGSTYPGGAMNPGANGGPSGAADGNDGLLMFNYGFGFDTIDPLDAPAPAIGGDYQVVSAAGAFAAKLYATGNIGTIRAGSMTVPSEPSFFRVNVNGDPTKRGTIDLIDVYGDFGTLADGGPHISTGPRGDVRYIRIAGALFRDPFFGFGQPNYTVYNPGVAATIQDDSGASLTFTPEPQRPDPANPTATLPAGQLFLETYPIESYQGNGRFAAGGGSVVIDAICTSSLTITSSAQGGADETAEIGRIEIMGVGTPVTDSTAITPVVRGTPIGQITNLNPVTQPLAPGQTTNNGPSTADGSLISQTSVNGGTEFNYQDGAVFFTTAANRTIQVPGTAGSSTGTGPFGSLTGQTTTASSLVFTFSNGTTVTLDTTTGNTSIIAGTSTTAAPTTISTSGASGLPGLQMTTTGEPFTLTISGSANVDVLNTVVTSLASTTGFDLTSSIWSSQLGNATSISNNTGGELVSLLAESVGTLFSAGTLGLAQHHTAAAVLPGQTLIAGDGLPAGRQIGDPSEASFNDVNPSRTTTTTTLGGGAPAVQAVAVAPFVGDLFPFGYAHQTIGIQIMHGNILTAEAKALGNFLVDGTIGRLIADAGGGGIAAPIMAFSLSSSSATQSTHRVFGIQAAMNNGSPLNSRGSIGSVSIGGGVAYSGSGYVSFGGIYTEKQLGPISGNSADIRGSIVSETGIDSISLRNGSLINAGVDVLVDPAMSIQPPEAIIITSVSEGIDVPTLDLGSISTRGNGGIIGTMFFGDHIGNITVSGGFGILNSDISLLGEGTANTIRADGYGIRGDLMQIGTSLGHLIASGNGSDAPTTTYSPDVRQSENLIWDPFTGRHPDVLTDLYAFLNRGTPVGGALVSAAAPSQPGVTDTGIIEDTSAVGSRDLGTVQAFSIRDNVLNLFKGSFNLLDTLTMRLDFANSIGTIQTTSAINGLEVTTGRVRKVFRPGSDVSRLVMTVAGNIKSIVINGSLLADSVINCSGINGTISNVLIKGDLNGTIQATKRIGTVKILGNLVGNVGDITGNVVEAGAINKLMIMGRILAGTFTINGNLGTLIMPGDIGAPGETFVIHGSAKTIQIGGNYNINTTIEGNLKTLKVGGSVISGTSISVAGALSTLQVGGDIQTGATITAHPLPPIKKRKIKGQVLGTLIG